MLRRRTKVASVVATLAALAVAEAAHARRPSGPPACPLDGLSARPGLPSTWKGVAPATLEAKLSNVPIVWRQETVTPTERCLRLQLDEDSALTETDLRGPLEAAGFRAEPTPKDGLPRYVVAEGPRRTSVAWVPGPAADELRLCVSLAPRDPCAARLSDTLRRKVTRVRPEYRRGTPANVEYTRVFPRGGDEVPGLTTTITFWCEGNERRPRGAIGVPCASVPEPTDFYTDGRGEREWTDRFGYELPGSRILEIIRFHAPDGTESTIVLQLTEPAVTPAPGRRSRPRP